MPRSQRSSLRTRTSCRSSICQQPFPEPIGPERSAQLSMQGETRTRFSDTFDEKAAVSAPCQSPGFSGDLQSHSPPLLVRSDSRRPTPRRLPGFAQPGSVRSRLTRAVASADVGFAEPRPEPGRMRSFPSAPPGTVNESSPIHPRACHRRARRSCPGGGTPSWSISSAIRRRSAVPSSSTVGTDLNRAGPQPGQPQTRRPR